MSFITLTILQKSFAATTVLRSFGLGLKQGEFVSLPGPSGCGKTTVLRLLAGFEAPTAGDIHIGGQSVVRQRPNQRRIGIVFQSSALFPNLTVAGNLAFGLRVGGMAPADIDRRVDEMLQMVGLSGFGDRCTFQLSGGQQQRVALARAIAPRACVLLPDEPLSAPDAKIRLSLRSEIRAIQRALGITTLFVTDDQDEALSRSDRVVVMQDGRAEQIGTPAEVYNTPATRCVAGFIGTLNLLDARVTDPAQGLVDAGGHSLSLGRPLDVARNAEVTLAIRPQAIDLAAPGAERAAALDICLPAMVRSIEFPGTIIRLVVTAGPARLLVDLFNRDAGDSPAVGSEVVLLVQGADVVLLAS